jgi:hypothetical protein
MLPRLAGITPRSQLAGADRLIVVGEKGALDLPGDSTAARKCRIKCRQSPSRAQAGAIIPPSINLRRYHVAIIPLSNSSQTRFIISKTPTISTLAPCRGIATALPEYQDAT